MRRPWDHTAAVGACALAVLLAVAAPRVASGQVDGTSTFDVTYTEVASDCGNNGMTLRKGDVVLVSKGKNQLQVRIKGIEPLEGSRAGKKFRAQARAATATSGVNANYSASGKVNQGTLQMVFIVEFYRGKKPMCTQSWSAQGSRK